QSGQLDDLANRSCRRTVDLDRHPFRDQGNFAVSQGIVLVEEAAGGDDQVAHAQILGSDPENGDIFFLAVAGRDSVRQSDDRRGRDDARYLLLHGRKVLSGQRVRGGTADVLRAALILGPDLVRADGLNLAECVLASGHTDGDHQDEGGSANDHAERGQRETDLVADKGVIGERKHFPQGQLGPKTFAEMGCRARHTRLDATERRVNAQAPSQQFRIRAGAASEGRGIDAPSFACYTQASSQGRADDLIRDWFRRNKPSPWLTALWFAALASVAGMFIFLPNSFDLRVSSEAMRYVRMGVDPYAVSLERQKAEAALGHDKGQAALGHRVFVYLYPPISIEFLKVLNMLPAWLRAAIFWMVYAVGFGLQLWAGSRFALEAERRMLRFVFPLVMF